MIWTKPQFFLTTMSNLHSDYMHESTLDLFCSEDDPQLAAEYAMEIERKAAELELTVDYYMQEFM